MIGLGLRLGVAGRRSVLVLAVTTAAMAVGTSFLLLSLTVAPAMKARADRMAWMDTFGSDGGRTVPAGSEVPHTTVSDGVDWFEGDSVTVVAVAGAGPGAPVPPGMSALPGTGEVRVSPALAELMRSEPVLRGRYGRVVGTIDGSALAGPNSLLAVRGVPAEAAQMHGTSVTAFRTRGEVGELDGIRRLLLLVGAVGTLAPIALLVALATRLSAATRDRRLSVLRLVGATNSQIARLAAVESLIAGIGGVVVGTALFFLVRPLATAVTFEDQSRWFTSDLTPSPLSFLAVVIGVPLVAAAATQVTLARIARTPLGVARRTAPKPVRAWRVVPLLVAVPALGTVLRMDSASLGHGPEIVLIFATLLLALVYAGPWITRVIGLGLARSNGPARMIAGRRLADDPRAGFRCIAGVILAILITTMYGATQPGAADSLRTQTFTGQKDDTVQVQFEGTTANQAETETLLRDVRAIDGVSDATLLHTADAYDDGMPRTLWFGDCAQIVAATGMTSVPCGEAPVIVAGNRQHLVDAPQDMLQIGGLTPERDLEPTNLLLIQASDVATMPDRGEYDLPELIVAPELAGPALTTQFRQDFMVLRADDAALEQVRTLVLSRLPGTEILTKQATYDGYNIDVRRLYRTISTFTLAVFVAAGFGLIVAVAAGLLERRRTFALLRISGTPLAMLRRTAFVEASAPLVVMAVLSTVLGAVVGRLLLSDNGMGTQPIPWLGIARPITVGLLASLLLVACAGLLVRRATFTEETRFE